LADGLWGALRAGDERWEARLRHEPDRIDAKIDDFAGN
jgi:hypothetical protein